METTTLDAQNAAAATAQGLDPITAALTAEEIAHSVANTGGFCMVVEIPADPGYITGDAYDAYLCVTPDQITGLGFDVAYYEDDDAEADVLGEALDLADALKLIRDRLDATAA